MRLMVRRLIVLVVILALGGSTAGPAARQALEWKRGSPLPLPRSEVAATTLGGELVVIGGFLRDGRSSARVDAYQPARDR
ncbi:MAG: kelch motif-containing protein, partial [Actinomycetota bacterium]|nr:kelch motif-containing protein [Actinomycetota bacterium]